MSFLSDVASAWISVLAAVTTLLGAIGALFKARHEYLLYAASRKSSAVQVTQTPADAARPGTNRGSLRVLLASIAIGGLLLGVSATVLVLRFAPSAGCSVETTPTISIQTPTEGANIAVVTDPNGSSHFGVRGISLNVSNNTSRRIYLLVHPERPVAPGWWIQPEVALDSEGRWSSTAWIGTKGFEASPGHELWIVAVVATRRSSIPTGADGQPWVDDPSVLEPFASSAVAHLRIASASSPPTPLSTRR